MLREKIVDDFDYVLADIMKDKQLRKHCQLFNYIQGLQSIINESDIETNLRVTILSQTFFIAGYLRALYFETGNNKCQELENRIEELVYTYNSFLDTIYDD